MEPTLENLYLAFTKIELENYRKYIYSIEAILNEESKKFVPAKDDAGQEHCIDLMETFPQYHRAASVISLYGFFESRLTMFVDKLMTKCGSKLRVKDISGQGLPRAKLALTKAVGWKMSTCSAEWAAILNGAKFRNVLVHRAGQIDPQNDDLVGYIKKNEYLFLQGKDRVSISSGYLLELVNTMISFKDKLMAENSV